MFKINFPFLCRTMLFGTAFVCAVPAQAATSPLVSRTELYLDTVITISLYDTDDSTILDSCFDKIQYYESIFSRTAEGSDVWNINHSEGEPVTVSDDTISLLTQAISYCEMTNGALDITIEPVSSLWDFHQGENLVENPVLPDPADIEEALTHLDYSVVQIDGNTVTLTDPEAGIDLGAIAKGYISDRIWEELTALGCESALVNLGGSNMLAVGSKPDYSDFNIGIRRPFSESAYDLIQKVSITDSSVITSGTYERYFEVDGTIYHHILSPETGYPVQTSMTSVSIVTQDGALGDALSTSCFVLGPEEGMALIESLPDVEALFIFEDETTTASSGWMGTPLN